MFWRWGEAELNCPSRGGYRRQEGGSKLGQRREDVRIFMGESEGQRYQMIILLSMWSEVHSILVPETQRAPHLLAPSVWSPS